MELKYFNNASGVSSRPSIRFALQITQDKKSTNRRIIPSVLRSILMRSKTLGMIRRGSLVLLLLFLLSFQNLFLSDVNLGDWTSVTTSDAVTFDGGNNFITGFVQMCDGFTLQDEDTSCTYASSFPVIGDVFLNGGKLYLGSDLLLFTVSQFTSAGTVYGQGHTIYLNSALTSIGCVSYPMMFCNTNLLVNSDLTINGSIGFSGNCVFNGNGRRISLSSLGKIYVDGDSSLLLKNITITGLSGNKIYCTESFGEVVLDSADLILDGNYGFTLGTIGVRGDLKIKGVGKKFSYQTAQTSTVCSNANLILDNGITFSYDPIYNDSFFEGEDDLWPLFAKDFLYLEDSTAKITLKNATLHVTETGMRLQAGHLMVKESSYVSSEVSSFSNGSQGLVFGTGGSSIYDCKLEILPNICLEVSSGALSYKNVLSSSLSMWDCSKISMASGTKLNIQRDMNIGNGIIEFKGNNIFARATGYGVSGSLSFLGSVGYASCVP